MSDAEETTLSDAPSLLATMLRRILRPLVRMLVGQQVQYPLVARLLKQLYIDVAAKDYALEGKRVTVSRLSLLTGIHRREVKRLQEDVVPAEAATPEAITLGAQIVARWTNEDPWVAPSGGPLPLVRQSDDADVPTFHALVNSVSVDIHPRSVLDEWLRIGVAELDDEGRVVLGADAFVPTRGFDEKVHFVGRNLRDHVAAASANLESGSSPHLERSVYYGALSPEAIAELEALAREVGQEALERVNERARALKEAEAGRDLGERAADRRFTFGVFQFDERASVDVDDEPEPEPDGGDGHA